MRTLETLVGLSIALVSQITAAQAPFPVVSEAEQLSRDRDRRAILLAELTDEQIALAKAKTDYANKPDDTNADTMRRHQENINALHRELGAKAQDDKSSKKLEQLATARQRAQTRRQLDPADAGPSMVPATGAKTPPPAWVIFADDAEATPDASPTRNSARAARVRENSAAAVESDEPPFVQMVHD